MAWYDNLSKFRNIRNVPTVLQDTADRLRRNSAGKKEKEEPAPQAAPDAAETPAAETSAAAADIPSADEVFAYFRQIAAIPHGSFHTEAISDYLEQFALDHRLSYRRDQMGNLIIRRPGSAGCEDLPAVALQGHIDMVCEKEASNPIDMEKEAITVLQDGDWLHADGTTLGGDDGIAVAIMLALLADDSLRCPPLECVFTVDEEVGLLGADGIDLSDLQSRRMINLDSEDEGIITAGCAGGVEVICTLTGTRREKKGRVLSLSVGGLRGGHSGVAIGQGRANADLVLARLLYRLESCGKYGIVSLNGGTRDNAIPRDAGAEIIFTRSISTDTVRQTVEEFREALQAEYSATDPDLRIDAQWITQEGPGKAKKDLRPAFTRKDSRRFVRFLITLPNGVIEYLPQQTDVPQTSLSLGIVRSMADGIRTHSLVRSCINSQKEMLVDRIRCLADMFDAKIDFQGAYPAWEKIEHSQFRDLAADVYEKLTGVKAEVQVIHGGLECGLLAAKVPGLDCISIGPVMQGVHTPAERLSISSSRRVYGYVREILAECAETPQARPEAAQKTAEAAEEPEIAEDTGMAAEAAETSEAQVSAEAAPDQNAAAAAPDQTTAAAAPDEQADAADQTAAAAAPGEQADTAAKQL